MQKRTQQLCQNALLLALCLFGSLAASFAQAIGAPSGTAPSRTALRYENVSYSTTRVISGKLIELVPDGTLPQISNDPAVILKNAHNITFRNCTFRNCKTGIYFGTNDGEGCSNITIENCIIEDCAVNGIQIPQNSKAGQKVISMNHDNIKIKNCIIRRTGINNPDNENPDGTTKGLDHGIYCQSSGVLIEDNEVYNNRGGGGISVRSSGIIRRNKVWNNAVASLGYYGDHLTPAGENLVIENNLCYEESLSFDNNGPIGFRSCSEVVSGPGKCDETNTVENVFVRFNTIIYNGDDKTGGRYGVFIQSAFAGNVYLYGNLIVYKGGSSSLHIGPKAPTTGSTGNRAFNDIAAVKFENILSLTKANAGTKDFRLKADSPARCAASTVPSGSTNDQYPPTDINNTTRDLSKDAGAYDYKFNTVCSSARLSYEQAEAESMAGFESQVTLYPNPAKEQLLVELYAREAQPVRLLVDNQLSQPLLAQAHQLQAGRNQLPVNIMSLRSGVYFLRIQQAGKQVTRKFVVK